MQKASSRRSTCSNEPLFNWLRGASKHTQPRKGASAGVAGRMLTVMDLALTSRSLLHAQVGFMPQPSIAPSDLARLDAFLDMLAAERGLAGNSRLAYAN